MPTCFKEAVVELGGKLVQLSAGLLSIVRIFADWCMDTSISLFPEGVVIIGTTIWADADIPEGMRDLVRFDDRTEEVVFKTLDGWGRAPRGSFIVVHHLDGECIASLVPDWRELFVYDHEIGYFVTKPFPVALVAAGRTEILGILSTQAANLWEEHGVWMFQTPRGVEPLDKDDMLVFLRFWEEPATLEGFVVKPDSDLLPILMANATELRLPQSMR